MYIYILFFLEIQALADNDIEYGYANHWEWNYYYFDASSDMSNFKIVVNQTDGN